MPKEGTHTEETMQTIQQQCRYQIMKQGNYGWNIHYYQGRAFRYADSDTAKKAILKIFGSYQGGKIAVWDRKGRCFV